jgi:hypothetical protein
MERKEKMFKTIKYTLFVTIAITSLVLTACGAKSTPEPALELNGIQTAVAETLAAQNTTTSTPAAPVVTQTPLLFSPTLTPLAPPASPTRSSNTTPSKCASASLVSETIPDGTIFKPGAQFTKTWEIKNTSTCSWDTTYKIIFWDGNVLGGGYVYNLPQAVDPGQTVPISLLLTAPQEETTYTSKWMLQTPDGVQFGVGQYNAPFYAEIAVSASTTPNYGVTSVEYNMVRDPATGCPANVTYTAYATVTTNGPLEFKYYWNNIQFNGETQTVKNPDIIKMKSAGSIVLSNSWKLHIATNTGTRWMAIAIGISDGDNYQYTDYPRVEFTKTCGG